MTLALSIVLFLLLSAVTSLLGVRLWARPRATVDRITGAMAPVEKQMPVHASLAFRDMVMRLGTLLHPTPSKSKLMEKRLIRAGYRNPGALRMVYGAKILAAVVLPLATFLVTAAFHLEPDTRWLVLAAAALVGFSAPGYYITWQGKRRQRSIRRGLPDALDLLVICVESGLGLDQALTQTAKELEIAHREISEEFTLVNLELRTGKRRAEALRNMAERGGVEELKKLVAVLIQADKFGTGIAQSLRIHADYMRVQARQTAEEKAAKVGVKLVFPIFFCILPTLFVVTVGPMAVRIVREMLPMMNNL